MKILGISGHYHDSAAALLIDGMPVAAVQEERLSRHKNDPGFPLAAIEWCLDHAGLSPEDLDAVIFYERPTLKFDRILTSLLQAWPHSWRSYPRAMKNMLGEKLWVRGVIASQLGISTHKVRCIEHHQSHAAAAFLTAPTQEAAILTADGVGEWATLTVGRGAKNADGSTEIELLRELRFPHSLGLFYSAVTSFLGFEVNEGEYKVMGLASYGTPIWIDQMRRLLRPTGDGAFLLDMDYFDFLDKAECGFSARFVDLFGPARNRYDPLDLDSAEGQRFVPPAGGDEHRRAASTGAGQVGVEIVPLGERFAVGGVPLDVGEAQLVAVQAGDVAVRPSDLLVGAGREGHLERAQHGRLPRCAEVRERRRLGVQRVAEHVGQIEPFGHPLRPAGGGDRLAEARVEHALVGHVRLGLIRPVLGYAGKRPGERQPGGGCRSVPGYRRDGDVRLQWPHTGDQWLEQIVDRCAGGADERYR